MRAHDPASPERGPNAVRCIVADDHPAIVDSVVRALEASGGVQVVDVASDGEHALRLIRRLEPEVALLDVRMPRFSGIEVARELDKEQAPSRVILYTAYADRPLLLDALDSGARAFVLKEAPLRDLLRAIRTVCDGGTYVDPAVAGLLAGPRAAERLPNLTKREREVLRLLADGMRNEEVATSLSISPVTVRTHVKKAMQKLEAQTRTAAVARALREALIA